MTGLEKELQYKLIISTRDLYEKYMQKAIAENDYQLVHNILEKIVIPDNALYWMALNEKFDIEILKKMFTKKLHWDLFIEKLPNIFQHAHISELTLNRLREIFKNYYPNLSHYDKIFLEQLLLRNDDYLEIDLQYKSYPASNISKNYKDINWFIDKAVCKAMYTSQHEFLEKLHQVMSRNNVRFKLNFLFNSEHKELIAWLKDNISRGQSGLELGWRHGYDGHRPSTVLEDYEKTLKLLYKYYL